MNKDDMLNQWEIVCTIDELSMDLDQKNLDKALQTFSEDARLIVQENGVITSQAQGKEEIKTLISNKMSQMDIIFHNNGTRSIDVKTLDQAAISRTHCIVRMIQKDPKAIINQYQWFEDKLIKVNGFWYIVERTIGIVSRSVM